MLLQAQRLLGLFELGGQVTAGQQASALVQQVLQVLLELFQVVPQVGQLLRREVPQSPGQLFRDLTIDASGSERAFVDVLVLGLIQAVLGQRAQG